MDSCSPNLYEQPQHSSSLNATHLSINCQSTHLAGKVNSLQGKQRDLSALRSGDLSAAVAELAADLNTPEISFDLQQFITSEIAAAANGNANGSAPGQLPALEDSVSLFNDLLEAKQQQQQQQQHHQQQQHQQQQHHLLQRPNSNNAHQVPTSNANNQQHSFVNLPQQQSRLGTDRYAETNQINGNSCLPTNIKREPIDSDKIEFATCPQSQAYSSGTSFSSFNTDRIGLGGHRALSESQNGPMSLVHFGSTSNAGHNSGRSSASSGHSSSGLKSLKGSKKGSEKGSDEYKKRRERNNIAVRKSREKAKMRSRETEKRVSELQRDNENLRKRVDLLSNQLNVLKALLTNVGVPAESIENEIARSLHMDGGHL